MKKQKIISSALSLVIALSCVPSVFAIRDIGSTDNVLYKVTFDSDSDKYTLKDGATLAEGFDGKAVKLDGAKNQYVHLEDNITEGMTGDYTISVDLYPENEASFSRIFDIGSGTDNFMYFTNFGGGIPKFRFKGDDLYSDGVMFNLNEWNSAIITKKNGIARLYINGEIAATSTTFVNDLAALGKTDKNYIGKSQYAADAYYTGMIDNFVIYDKALDESDIKLAVSDGEVQVKSGYQNNGNEVLFFKHGDSITAYGDIHNYKKEPLTASLINIVYNGENGIKRIVQSNAVVINSGDSLTLSNNIDIPETDALISSYDYTSKVVSYIYTDIGGLEKMSEISLGNANIAPLPEDTMETTIGVHDPSIFKDPKSGTYYVYSTGMIDIFKSDDLVNWTKTVNTLPEVPQCVYDLYKHDKKTEYSNIWAPDMFYDESDTKTPYHLTCSYSDAFGKNNSSLILFKSASPDGPWENGEIIFTSITDDEELGKVNAIDSNICVDHETGQKYMTYGSFWQGIFIKELNSDGTLKDPKTVGTRLMSRYKGNGGPEGPYIIYNEDTGYYYLFTSYDNLSETYQIRVARSKNILGPYVDHNGNSVDRYNDDDSEAKNIYGYKLIGSYQFPNGTNYYGPGHNSILHDGDDWYLVHHVRTVKGGFATLNVRTMIWNSDGWPIVTPERYQAESDYNFNLIPGQWNYISIGDNTNTMLTSQKLLLNSDGTALLGDVTGSWNINTDNSKQNILEIKLGTDTVTAFVSPTWDSDNNCPTVQFTGTDQNNVAKWGKKAITTSIYK